MTSRHEQFWDASSFAFVGNTAKKGFPRLSYGKTRALGKKVFAIDPTCDEIERDTAYSDFAALPEKVDAAVLEVPREDTADWVRKAADAGIEKIWIHAHRDTPEAIALGKEKGVELLTGACAVMYVNRTPSVHSIHKWIAKLGNKY